MSNKLLMEKNFITIIEDILLCYADNKNKTTEQHALDTIVMICEKICYNNVIFTKSTYGSPEWMKYNNGIWNHIMNINVYLSTMFDNVHKNIKKIINKSKKLSFNDNDKKNIACMIRILKNQTQYKTLLINKLSEKIYVPKTICLWNKNKKIICFLNGVYDFNIHKLRNGEPTDYIISTTGYSYEHFDFDNNNVGILANYLRILMSDVIDDMDKLLDVLMNIVSGIFNNKKILIYSYGKSGASVFIKLLVSMLGDYCQLIKYTEDVYHNKLSEIYEDKKLVILDLRKCNDLSNLNNITFNYNVMIFTRSIEIGNMQIDNIFCFDRIHNTSNSDYSLRILDNNFILSMSKHKKIFMSSLIKRYENKCRNS